MNRSLLRVNEAAAVLNVSRWTVYRWVEEGKLEGTKIGKGSLRIFHESIADLIQEIQVDRGDVMPGSIATAYTDIHPSSADATCIDYGDIYRAEDA